MRNHGKTSIKTTYLYINIISSDHLMHTFLFAGKSWRWPRSIHQTGAFSTTIFFSLFLVTTPILIRWTNTLIRKWSTSFHKNKQITEKKSPPSALELFFSSRKAKFLQCFERTKESANENIDSLFYHRREYEVAMKINNHPIETAWKRRIMMDTTPRGNIMMYYDAYKHGFAYYADSTIPYVFLNASAMKYVALYQCCDFFLDEHHTPNHAPSPISAMMDAEEKEEMQKKRILAKKTGLARDMKSGPFAKLKNYQNVAKPSTIISQMIKPPMEVKTWYQRLFPTQPQPLVKTLPKLETGILVKQKEEPACQHKNKFLYMGKMANFSLLQKRPEETTARVETSCLFTTNNEPWRQTKTFTIPNHPDNSDNTSTSTGPTSWKEFKKRKQTMA